MGVAVPTPEHQLAALGLILPPPWAPGATLEMAVEHDGLLYLSGHMGVEMVRSVSFHGRSDHRPIVQGTIGREIGLGQACEIARGGALNLIATLKDRLGELSRVERILRATYVVRADAEFAAVHTVADAACDLLIAVFGDAGRHARTTIGATTMPGGSCFAADAVVAIRDAKGAGA